MKKLNVAIIVILFIVGADTLRAQLETPTLQQRVTDFTNTLTYNDWRGLESKLQRFEDSTSNQIAVLLINSLEGEDLFDYSMKVFDANKIGARSKNNGVLIVVVKGDRKIRIMVGYGLEGVLTDALTSQIIDREMKPYFKAENYYAGLSSGVAAIIAATTGEYTADERGKNAPMITVIMVLVFMGIMGVIVLPAMAARRRYYVGSKGSRYVSGWGWPYGGSWGSGSSGGSSFSGGGWSGGGGMSGGGGASGSW